MWWLTQSENSFLQKFLLIRRKIGVVCLLGYKLPRMPSISEDNHMWVCPDIVLLNDYQESVNGWSLVEKKLHHILGSRPMEKSHFAKKNWVCIRHYVLKLGLVRIKHTWTSAKTCHQRWEWLIFCILPRVSYVIAYLMKVMLICFCFTFGHHPPLKALDDIWVWRD